ncbi:MAG: ROK family protein [Omnitrophica WOR_2 bacterium]
MNDMYGGIEAGGTKFVCAVGSGPNDILAETRFPTTNPDETLSRAIAFFKEQAQVHPVRAIGIAAFGPVDLHPGSATYGFITSTPKPGWAYTRFAGAIADALELPVEFDTDVNGAVFGEHAWGAGQGLDNLVYLTIGTGIGGGCMVNGSLVHGLVHTEMGHIGIPHDLVKDPFPGACPYHGDCFEGLASGPAIEKRWGQRGETLTAGHPAWELEAGYLADALCNFIYTVSPERIILGGGVMEQPHLFTMLRRQVVQKLNGYIASPAILEDIDHYIVPPGLGKRAGVLGAIALGQAGFLRSRDIISKSNC